MNPIVRNIGLWFSETVIASFIEIFLGVLMNIWNRIVAEYNLPLKKLDIAYHYGVSIYVDASTSYDPRDFCDGDEATCDDLISLDEEGQEPLVSFISGSDSVKFMNRSTTNSTYSEGDHNSTKRYNVISHCFFDSIENCEAKRIADTATDNTAEICNPQANILLVASSSSAISPSKGESATVNLEYGDTDISPTDAISKYSSDNAKIDFEWFDCEGQFFDCTENSIFEIDESFKEILACYNDKCYIKETEMFKNLITESFEKMPLILNKNQEEVVRQNQNTATLIDDSDHNLHDENAETFPSNEDSMRQTTLSNEEEYDHSGEISNGNEMVKYVYSPINGKFLKKTTSQEDNRISDETNSDDKSGTNDDCIGTDDLDLEEIKRDNFGHNLKVDSDKTNGAIRQSLGTESCFQLCTTDEKVSFENDKNAEKLDEFASSELINAQEDTSGKLELNDCSSFKFSDAHGGFSTKLIEPCDIRTELAHSSTNYEHTYYTMESHEHFQLDQALSHTIMIPPVHADILKHSGEQNAGENIYSIISIQENVQEFVETASVTQIDRDNKKVHFNTEVKTFTYEPDSSIVENFNLEKESATDDTLMGAINDKAFFMPSESNDFIAQTARIFLEDSSHRPESNFMEEWVQKEHEFQENDLPFPASDPFTVNSEPEDVIDVPKKDLKSWPTFKDLHRILRKKSSIEKNLSHSKSQVPTKQSSSHSLKVDPKILMNKFVKKVFRK